MTRENEVKDQIIKDLEKLVKIQKETIEALEKKALTSSTYWTFVYPQTPYTFPYTTIQKDWTLHPSETICSYLNGTTS